MEVDCDEEMLLDMLVALAALRLAALRLAAELACPP